MPCGKAPINPIAGPRERRARFAKRKEGLMKKARELATLCVVPVAVVCSGVDGEGDPEYWPSKEVAEAVTDRYRELPENERKKHMANHPAYLVGQLANQRSKLVGVQEGGGIADLLGTWGRAHNDMPEEALRELLRSIEDSLVAARARIQKLQPQHDGEADHAELVLGLVDVDEVMAENSVTGDADADADWLELGLGMGMELPLEGNFKPQFAAPVDVDVDEAMAENSVTGDGDPDADWLELGLGLGLGMGMELPLEGNFMPQFAGPVDVDEAMAEHSVTGDADADGDWLRLGVGLELLGGNTMPPNAAPVDVDEVAAENSVTVEGASDGLQGLQPPGDDADDAVWMQKLVQALNKKPEPSNAAPANGNAAPYNAGIEYINVGGYVMERDAYDFYDLGMPPPSLEPEFPDYSEPLQLWSWDESSIPQSVSPPPPQEGWDSGALTQPEDQRFDGGMSASSNPGNGAVTSSPSVERKNSRSPIDDMAIVLHEPQVSDGKTRGGKGKTRGRKGKNGTLTSDSSVEREIPRTTADMAIVPYEPQGSKGKTRGGKGKPRGRKGKIGTITSNSSVESERPVSPIKDMPVVPHDPEDTDGQTKCKKGKKRGRHFDRVVRVHILQGSYLTKAENMAEIKVKQEEDKHAARLHSFSGDSVMSKGSKPSTEKTDMARSLKYISAPWKNKASKSEEYRPVVYPEVILCVEIYEKRYGSVKSQEFLVLGSQLLKDLKDNIYCLTDKLVEVARQRDHSGYFLIEDTFYNDSRHYSAVDYSKPILDWFNNSSDEVAEKWDTITSGVLKKRQKDLLSGLNISNEPEFKSAKMQRTCFSDMHFRLGAGYLYCHQGNCKHMIVIRDMRLIHPEDTQNQAEYPLMTFQLQKRLQKCSVCQIYHATKMTVDDKWALNNPCHFCIQCYYLLHYKEDGSLLYPHIVYDYHQE